MSGTYCGTADCILVSRDWTDLTTSGTVSYASDYIAAASDWVDAVVGDWHEPVSPLTAGGTVYDYWTRMAAARYAVWMAYDSVMRDKYEAGTDPYWAGYRTEALAIMGSLRDARSALRADPAQWERGIAPASAVANGTVSAAFVGVMISNHETGQYTADDAIPRTFLIQLDGTGTDVFHQTYKWQYKGGTAWEQSTQTIQPDTWHHLTYGVAVGWPSQAGGTVAAGQRWEVACYPCRGGNYRKGGAAEWDFVIG